MDYLSLPTFRQCVDRCKSDHRAHSFSCYDQFLCLAFAQLTYRESLRDADLGRESNERTDDARSLFRNGYKPFRLKGIFSSVTLRRPVLRGATPPSAVLASLRRAGSSLLGVLGVTPEGKRHVLGTSPKFVVDKPGDQNCIGFKTLGAEKPD